MPGVPDGAPGSSASDRSAITAAWSGSGTGSGWSLRAPCRPGPVTWPRASPGKGRGSRMEQSSTPLKVVLGALSIGVLGLLGFLILQAAKPTIKNPQPLSGTTTPKGEVTVGADVYGEADLKEVRLRLD